MKHYISRQTFSLIFKECMTIDTYIDNSYDYDNDKILSYPMKIKPLLAIRDFDTGKETEFKNERIAWEYFETLERCRVMSADGQIFLDAFD